MKDVTGMNEDAAPDEKITGKTQPTDAEEQALAAKTLSVVAKSQQKSKPKDAGGDESAENNSAKENASFKETIEENAREDERPLSSNFTLRKILGGDILNAQFMRRQIGLILLVAGFTIVYIANRYSCQKDMLEIDKLNTTLQEAKYKALSSSSLITEKSRESHILEMLKGNSDSTLKIAKQPPYIINVPE
jgi:hypothetical protein